MSFVKLTDHQAVTLDYSDTIEWDLTRTMSAKREESVKLVRKSDIKDKDASLKCNKMKLKIANSYLNKYIKYMP